MVEVYKNMDTNQKLTFKDVSKLKEWMLKNPNQCDGLAFNYVEEWDEFAMDIVFIDGNWEVEIFEDGFETNVLDFEVAVAEFCYNIYNSQ